METTFSKPVLKILFGLYLMGLGYLAFVYQRSVDLSWLVKGGLPVLMDTMKFKINFIPFRSILDYLAQMNRITGMKVILDNIVAHLIAMSWLGYFMPRLWPKYKKRKVFIVHVFIGLLMIEFIQFLTMSGNPDIDDVLINLLGAYLGIVFLRRPEITEGELNHD